MRAAGAQALKRRDHAGDGVIEGGVAIEVGLPEFLQQFEILAPSTLIEALAQSVRSVAAARDAAILVSSGRTGGAEHWPDDFTCGVENQSVPKVARDGFVTLVAFPDDGGLYRLGDTVRTLVE